MATVKPSQRIVAADATELAALKTYLDGVGYTVGGSLATRVDDGLTVTIEYPEWSLEV